ncbi:PREDICTED: ameloblastin [Elephantulus edwardii]|uniref:ameloblastin n=1 Tax=Elephantulus edwardii TaxID=28737 RepID=UPI0003F0EE89|nr:PREDICTED: ameloblastin [Elephantulus edwardii]
MSALKIPLFKMKDPILFMCLLGVSVAVPVFPQQPGTPGMASLSLETMRQLGRLQGLNILPQFSRFGFGKSFNPLWLHGLLPPHSSFPWLRPRDHETQQYEYSLPVHPPPLPSQQSLQPQQPGQKPSAPTAATVLQGTAPKIGPQPPIHQGLPPLQQSDLPMVQQQVAPSEKPLKAELPEINFAGPQDPTLPEIDFAGPQGPTLPEINFADPQVPTMLQIARLISQGPVTQTKQSPLYPGMFYMPYGANQLNAPGRLGIMSSEEMVGGRGGPMAYGAIFPGFGRLRPGFGGMAPNQGKGGDFTLEFDTPGATKGPEKGEGGTQEPHRPAGNPANLENPTLLTEFAHGGHAGLLAPPKGNIFGVAKGPAGHSWGSLRVTPADPLATPGLADLYETYGPDATTPPGFQDETTTDSTVTPDTAQTSMPVNKGQQPQIMHNAWHFQEP